VLEEASERETKGEPNDKREVACCICDCERSGGSIYIRMHDSKGLAKSRL
jgi:hypothetical protein